MQPGIVMFVQREVWATRGVGNISEPVVILVRVCQLPSRVLKE